MRFLLLLSVLVLFPVTLSGEENWYRTANVSAHDADTVKCDVIFPWGVTLREQTIRLAGVDAWEVTKQRQTVNVTTEEVAKGKKALADFNALRAKGRLEVQPLTYLGTDSVYSRREANWRVVLPDANVDIADWIRKNGHERN